MDDFSDKRLAGGIAVRGSTRIPELPAHFYLLDNWNCLRMLSTDLVIISVAILICNLWFAYPLAVLLIGARQRAIADILHQSTHRALARNPILNKTIGVFAGYLVFQTWRAYWKSHVANHHGKFGTSGDPDYAFYRGYGFYGRVSWRGVAGGFQAYARYLIVGRLMQIKGGSAAYFEYMSLVAFWVCATYAFGAINIVWYWLVPMVLGFGPIGYLVELAEHWPLMEAKSSLFQTRNRSSSRIEGWLFSTHHENYHLLHHLYPRLPNSAFQSADRHLRNVWPEYCDWAARNGGVILSSNGAPSVLQLLVAEIHGNRADSTSGRS